MCVCVCVCVHIIFLNLYTSAYVSYKRKLIYIMNYYLYSLFYQINFTLSYTHKYENIKSKFCDPTSEYDTIQYIQVQLFLPQISIFSRKKIFAVRL